MQAVTVKPAIFIDVDGDEWEESIDRSSTLVKECTLTPEQIVAKVKDAGVVGMGGACFPHSCEALLLRDARRNVLLSML